MLTVSASHSVSYAASSRRQEHASEEISRDPRVSDPIQHAVPDGRWGPLTSPWDALRRAVQH